jgi:hypothetical protein
MVNATARLATLGTRSHASRMTLFVELNPRLETNLQLCNLIGGRGVVPPTSRAGGGLNMAPTLDNKKFKIRNTTVSQTNRPN